MAEYIGREEMREVLEKSSISTRFADIPKAANVRPERHGAWLYCGDGYECSECGGGAMVGTNPFCWKCGAKMDKKMEAHNDR